MGEVARVQLRRMDTTQPWGFKMQGGTDVGVPLHVAQVNPKGLSAKCGLRPGDGILEICNENATQWSHDTAKAAMVRAGNEIDFVVQRNAVTPKPRKPKGEAHGASPRSELCEDSINPGMNQGSKFRDVKPKTYQVMKDEEESGGGAPPASIFGRKKEDRSKYLKEDKKTIQKAFGQS
ncbi:PDZ and LIM domain protein 7 [Octopus bimaculoides]|nr:PDZ and LIM domain protein 7 [Octopus bimaculoides]|eukprot:XP_014774579.1 PREDICTED: PDZ and LIM domain protein 7-like [Octopus bimaculoides]